MADKKKNKRVSDKIEVLRGEGVPEKQAIAESMSMERKGRLGAHGTYYRTPHKRSRRNQ